MNPFQDTDNEEKTYLKANEIARENLGNTRNKNPEMFAENLRTVYNILMKTTLFYYRTKNKTKALKYAEKSLQFAKNFPEEFISEKDKAEQIQAAEIWVNDLK